VVPAPEASTQDNPRPYRPTRARWAAYEGQYRVWMFGLQFRKEGQPRQWVDRSSFQVTADQL